MAAALPLGFTSRCELIDIWFHQALDTAELTAAIQTSAPPGLLVQKAENIELRQAALQVQVAAAEYVAHLCETPPGFDLAQAVTALLAQNTLSREWRKKPYDLRPLIEMLVPHGPDLEMRLRAREGSTGRPEEVLSALGLDPTTARVERTRLILNGE
jgi:radical SAM-linked protein